MTTVRHVVTLLSFPFLLLMSVASGAPLQLPEPSIAPQDDPLLIAKPPPTAFPSPSPGAHLFLISAGRAPYFPNPVALSAYSTVKVCATNYRNGFSVQCDVDTNMSVEFLVDGMQFQTEYRAPFMLNGDKDGNVYPFRRLGSNKSVRVACQAHGRRAVWVDLVREC